MSIFGHGLQAGSAHVLIGSDRSETIFEWTGKSWSTPGTRWGTKPSGMMATGWRYGRPAQCGRNPKGQDPKGLGAKHEHAVLSEAKDAPKRNSGHE